MSDINHAAAKLAAELVDDLDKLEQHGLHLKLTFTVEAADFPEHFTDDTYIYESVTVTREALFTGGEWKWTKSSRLNEPGFMHTKRTT